jgi:hypothetical protein
MRKSLWIILTLAFAAIASPTALRAGDITYRVNSTVGAGNVTGFITTDGVIGDVLPGDIVNWNLTVYDGSNPSVDLLGPLSGNNSEAVVTELDLTATAKNLLFNFSDNEDGFLIFELGTFEDNKAYLCYSGIADPVCTGAPSSVIALDSLSPESNVQYNVMSGDDVIASVATTPEPSSVLLFGTALLGLAPFRKKLFGR